MRNEKVSGAGTQSKKSINYTKMQNRTPVKMVVDHLASMLNDDKREAWQERSAIREFDGGMSREKAEDAALMEIMKG